MLQTEHEISIDDNFFESGGHSLLATRLASYINDKFSTSLPIRSVFEAPDISRLSVMIIEQLSQETG